MAEYHVHVEVTLVTKDDAPAPTLADGAAAILMGLEHTMNVPLDEDGNAAEESGKPVVDNAGSSNITALGIEVTAGNPEGTAEATIVVQTHQVTPGTDDIIRTTGNTGGADW